MEKDNSYLLEIFDIAKYAVSIEDEKVYRRAKDMLLEELYAYIQEQLNSEETKKRGICFTEVQIDLMKQVLNMTCKSDNNFFSHDSFLINIWFFPTQYVPISEDTWQIIWYFVTQVVDAGNEEWFLSYWTFAEQFYRFYLEDRYDIDASVSKQKSIFKQFHLALGAYLWHKGKYNLLKQILYFTQTLPPSYPLMDNTLIEIFNDIKRIYDLKEHPLELTKRYMMSDMVNDVHSDVYIARMFNSYFALLMLRLKDMDYNVSYCDSQSFPLIDPDSSIQGLNEQIKHADILLYFLNDKDFTNKSQKIGYNSDEGLSFPTGRTPEEFIRNVHERFGPYAVSLMEAYPVGGDRIQRSARNLMRDAAFGWHTWSWARLQTKVGKAPVYFYYFDQHAQNPEDSTTFDYGSSHGMEVAYVFMNLDPNNPQALDSDLSLSETMGTYWTNFAKYGDPNGETLTKWPVFSNKYPQVMCFGSDAYVDKVPDEDALNVLDSYFVWRRAPEGVAWAE